MKSIVKEVCLENATFVQKAIAYKADRIELCDHLHIGGTTVSTDICENVVRMCKGTGVEVMAMVRPRGGDFVYSEADVHEMAQTIKTFTEVGVDGVVLGCLTKNNKLDLPHLQTFLSNIDPRKVTFHMAFDAIKDPFNAIDQLSSLHVKRILTHGPHQAIDDNIPRLKAYNEYAAGRIIIMPGGGITTKNVASLAKITGTTELHGTRILW
ncbi:copper homeostasis protein CutC [Shouchella sp. JSM 1781072]|uniref:copper homeostasis protein CutC n=1 Tax=Shouchella sp. JSM 1781072 TaxID=3344581 RepID=UPI0035BFF6C3